ncbi:hypothetical protein C0989_005998 [Termitomyces sp. Mn162]|nr:hypothetical protein C0989_005998 [Termitomyces sp. Mn162]
MLYQYRCYLTDLEDESFEYDSFYEDDKQRVDLAVGSLTQLQSLRAVPLLPTSTPSEPMDNGPVTYTHLLPHYVNDDLVSSVTRNTKPDARYPYTSSFKCLWDTSHNTSLTGSETFAYPFGSLPSLISHIHPRFVIRYYGVLVKHINIRHLPDFSMRDLSYQPITNAMLDIYDAWIKDIPSRSRFFRAPSAGLHNNDVKSNNSSRQGLKTIPRRLHLKSFIRAQKKYRDRLTARRHRKKQRPVHTDGLQSGIRLDRKTLRIIEGDETPNAWRKVFLKGWITQVSQEAFSSVNNLNSDPPNE